MMFSEAKMLVSRAIGANKSQTSVGKLNNKCSIILAFLIRAGF